MQGKWEGWEWREGGGEWRRGMDENVNLKIKFKNIERHKRKSVRWKSETQNLGDQKFGGKTYGTTFKTFILKRKKNEVKKIRTRLELKSENMKSTAQNP